MEKEKATPIKIESRNNCTIHSEKRAVRICDDCELPYCNDCIKEYWTHNFLSYAYLGESKDFKKHWLCIDCMNRKRKKGVLTAIFILFGVIILTVLMLIYNYMS